MLIIFEGIDGAGKSTQVELLAKHLQKRERLVHTTCEPTVSPVGKLLRKMLHDKNIFKSEEAEDEFIALLITTDRFHHVYNKDNGVTKYLKDGYDVIMDRYYYSTFAYNAVSEEIHDYNIRRFPKPDIKIFLDIHPILASKRLCKLRSNDKYETLDKLRKTSIIYDAMLDYDKTWIRVDATLSPDDVHSVIREAVDLKILQDEVANAKSWMSEKKVNANQKFSGTIDIVNNVLTGTSDVKPEVDSLIAMWDGGESSTPEYIARNDTMHPSNPKSPLASVQSGVEYSVMIEKMSKSSGYIYRPKGGV